MKESMYRKIRREGALPVLDDISKTIHLDLYKVPEWMFNLILGILHNYSISKFGAWLNK